MVWRNLAGCGQPYVRVIGAAEGGLPSGVLTAARLFSCEQWRTCKAISTTSREALQRQYRSARERVSGVRAPLAAAALPTGLSRSGRQQSLTQRLWACSRSDRAETQDRRAAARHPRG